VSNRYAHPPNTGRHPNRPPPDPKAEDGELAYLLLALVGLLAGLLGGLLGIGGSVVMIPFMRELPNTDQHLCQAAAMIVNFFVITPAVYQHLRQRAVLWPVVRFLAPAATVSVIGGVLLSDLSIFRGDKEIYLAGVFGLFLYYVAGMNLRRLLPRLGAAPRETWDPQAVRWHGPVLVGIAVGIVGGLLGVGGGIVSVPLQQKFLRIPLRNAIANSAATIVLLSIVGAAMKNYTLVARHGHELSASLGLAGVLIPMAIVGGFFGGRLTHTLPLRAVRGAFVLLMVVAGTRMVWRALSPLLG
jgi:uncharacterized membrane protein YfcA